MQRRFHPSRQAEGSPVPVRTRGNEITNERVRARPSILDSIHFGRSTALCYFLSCLVFKWLHFFFFNYSVMTALRCVNLVRLNYLPQFPFVVGGKGEVQEMLSHEWRSREAASVCSISALSPRYSVEH